jgi:endonuclease YncB( thermonuclease family)
MNSNKLEPEVFRFGKATVIVCLLLVGCKDSVVSKSLPTPIRDKVEYSLTGEIERVWGGDHFEFGDQNELHYILVRGVDCPKYAQEFYTQARHSTMDWTANKQVRIEIVDRDEMMTEIADVYVGDGDREFNLALRLIAEGLGWYDGNEFEGSAALETAQATAKENRIGLWSSDNPIPPWEFESKKAQTILNKLKIEK